MIDRTHTAATTAYPPSTAAMLVLKTSFLRHTTFELMRLVPQVCPSGRRMLAIIITLRGRLLARAAAIDLTKN